MIKTDQLLKLGAAAFILAVGVSLILYVTVFHQYTKNTQANQMAAKKIIRKALTSGLIN